MFMVTVLLEKPAEIKPKGIAGYFPVFKAKEDAQVWAGNESMIHEVKEQD